MTIFRPILLWTLEFPAPNTYDPHFTQNVGITSLEGQFQPCRGIGSLSSSDVREMGVGGRPDLSDLYSDNKVEQV